MMRFVRWFLRIILGGGGNLRWGDVPDPESPIRVEAPSATTSPTEPPETPPSWGSNWGG